MQVKVCGITSVDDAIMAANQGIDYLGYIVNYPTSPRHIQPITAAHIIRQVRVAFPNIRHVAVVVDPSETECNQLIEELDCDIVQFHGNESPEFIKRFSFITKWKAIELHRLVDLDKIPQYTTVADGIVIDSGKGSGQPIAAELLQQVHTTIDLVLAGGIYVENIIAMTKLCRPNIIDLNSGVELRPNKKDPNKLAQCLATMQNL